MDKKILIFDTETGGVDAENSDILQLSYQVIDYGTQQVLKTVDKFFPFPEDKSRVSSYAMEINGLTEEYLATKELADRSSAIEEFFEDMEECAVIVAHNGDFDKRFISATAIREGLSVPEWKPMIDTMKTTAELCVIPNTTGHGTGKYKWPRLNQLAEFLKIDMDGINLHDSSSDVELTKRCFLCLLEKKFYEI